MTEELPRRQILITNFDPFASDATPHARMTAQHADIVIDQGRCVKHRDGAENFEVIEMKESSEALAGFLMGIILTILLMALGVGFYVLAF